MLGGEHGLFQSVLLKEVVNEPNVKEMKCFPVFCYLSNTLGAGGGLEVAARARVRCTWVKFEELSPILTARGIIPYNYRERYTRLVSRVSVLTYGIGTATLAMKKTNLHSLEQWRI